MLGGCSAYDLARDITRDLNLREQVIDYGVDSDGEPYANLNLDEVERIVEALLVAALRNGGIQP